MRVAIFCNDFWPTVGGVQTGVWGLSRALQRRGHPTLILTRQPPGIPAAGVVDGIEVRRFRWGLHPRWTLPARAVRAGIQVLRLTRAWRPDVVFVHFVSVDALYAWAAARGARVPLILSFRGNDALRIAERSAVTRVVYRLIAQAADFSLFCSAWLRDQTTRARWFAGLRVSTGVLEDAVEVGHREQAPSDLEPYVLAAGRLVVKKGFDLLLRAWATARAHIPATLWIAGDGPEEATLRSVAAREGVTGSVRFLGPVPHARLLGLLERSALCIVPSREEPYGIIVVEGQALGVPVLACAVGNIPVLIEHGVTGYLAPPTAEGLARGLIDAWADPFRAAVGVRGQAARGAARTYDKMAGEVEEWASRVSQSHARGRRWI